MNAYLENVKANYEASIRGWNAAMNGEPLSPKDETDRLFLHGYHEASLHLEWRKMTKLPIKYPEHPETISDGTLERLPDNTESLLRDILAELRALRQDFNNRPWYWPATYPTYPYPYPPSWQGTEVYTAPTKTEPQPFYNDVAFPGKWEPTTGEMP